MSQSLWEKELRLFTGYDLNKASWRGGFQVDSVKDTNKGITTLVYKSIDESISLKRVEIVKRDGAITSIEILDERANSLYRSSRHLRYDTGSGFYIKSSEKVRLQREKNFEVIASF